MLRAVLRIVQDEGWFDTKSPFEKTVYISQGFAQCVLLSRNGRPDTFVKFTELASLADEAAKSRTASERFPNQAPGFLGYATRAPLEVLVTRAVDFRPLDARMMAGGADGRAVGLGMEDYFRRMRSTAPAAADPAAAHGWYADMCAYFQAYPMQDAAQTGLRRLGAALSELPPFPQHGDLVLNNLGLGPRRQLVIFDWEDYGAVQLPGLDLFTLENSLRHDLEQHGSTGLTGPSASTALDMDRLCKSLGLAPHLYHQLGLGYALTFRYLKRNYGPEVRERLDRLIGKLAAELVAAQMSGC